jgi:hypothetical protein
MKIQAQKTERLYALDSLGAIMMLLGLVIHSAITYGTIDYGSAWSLKDPSSTLFSNDIIVVCIHAFRMQTFFLVAGFFGAMLFYERKPLKMLKNRTTRIVLPFLVFLILLWPTIVFSFDSTGLIFEDSTNALAETLANFSSLGILIPQSTFHLWFLYYLAMITFVSVGLALVFRKLPKLTSYISKAFSWVIQKTILRIVIFAGISALVYFIMGTYELDTSNSLVPDFNTFIYYFVFYIIGWILFKSKHLLKTFLNYDWINTALGIILFLVYVLMNETLSYEVTIILKSLMVWCLVLGITGLFLGYGGLHSAKMRYISDASYWVYLIHLSLTAIIPSFIMDWQIPPTLKFLVVVISTATICFVSYHYLVRGTFIGKFLNGKKYTRKLSDIKETPAVPQIETALIE